MGEETEAASERSLVVVRKSIRSSQKAYVQLPFSMARDKSATAIELF